MLHQLAGKSPVLHPMTFMAPGSHIIGDVTVGEGSSIWFNTVLRGDLDKITVGRYVNLQDNAVLHVDKGYPVTVGDYVTVGHGAILHSCCVGRGAMLGMGSILLTGAVVEDESLLAAGSLVPEGKTIPARVLAMGSPAKVVRELSAGEVDKLKSWAQMYAEKWRQYYSDFNS